jgi:DNA mismatch endonuclease, patch repair protein
MSRIKGKDTSPELIVRRLLHKMGYRFRLHVRIPIPEELQTSNLKPETSNRRRSVSVDIVLPKYKTAIFVHGCFWHQHKGCKECTTPTNRREWWLEKLNGNAERDTRNRKALMKIGWKCCVLWECALSEPEKIAMRLTKILMDKEQIR